MKKQAHLFYSGSVQGVGFRYTAQDIARSLGVCGWVKNTQDGRVEIIAEGKEESLDIFMAQINQRLKRYIGNQDLSWEKAGGEFKDFQIEY